MEIKGEDFLKKIELKQERDELEKKLKELSQVEDIKLNSSKKSNNLDYEFEDIKLNNSNSLSFQDIKVSRSFVADWITIVLGMFAFGNFIYSLIYGTSTDTTNFPDKPQFNIIFQFILFIVVETVLAYIFGRILIKLELIGRGIPIIVLWLIAIISAWTSMFNIQWLLTGELTRQLIHSDGILGFSLSVLVALVIAIYLIYSYIDTLSITDMTKLSKYRISIWIQSVCYLGVFILHIFKFLV